MKKYIALSVLAAATLIVAPTTLRAQDATSTNAPAATAHAKKHGAGVHGKVTAVDATASTLTIKDKTYNVTSTTKIIKDEKPAALADIQVGDAVRLTFKKDAATGQLNATVIHVGEKKKAE
jgi:preprotein translocase subunit YajC